jgi:hypothetical protein
MMTIAAECSEITKFTPSVLANIAVPPVFRLRPASGREARKYNHILRSEGLKYHQVDDFREETLKALKQLWSAEDYEENAARLQAYWNLVDQNGTPDDAEKTAVDELTERLADVWRPLAKMAADNMEFVEEAQKIALAMFLVGWSGVDLGYSREAGRVPLERLLGAMEEQAIADKVEGVERPGIAFLQLCNAASARLYLTRDEEKNSSSPPPVQPDQAGSTKKPSVKTEGAPSKAPASSKPAPPA